MKKRKLFASGIISLAALLLLPMYATDEVTHCAFAQETCLNEIFNDDDTVIVDTVDVDTMTIGIQQNDSTDEASDDGDDISDDDENLPWPENVRHRIEKIFDNTTIFNTSMVGMKIYDLTADSTIYERNASQLMRPASTLKMMVAVTAIDRLGAGYELKTRMAYTGRTDSLTLRGNLYVKGGFDPTIGSDDIAEFADSVKALGIDTIDGNIYLDLSMKDKDRLGEGWCWDDDNPVLSPLLAGRKEEFGERLQRKLRQNGITVTGTCSNGSMPSGAHTLYIKRTPLLEVMRRQLKRSDNLYSEAIFYQLAAEVAGRNTASARHGRQAVNAIISKVGRRPSAYYIADGSGLSLYNYVSPELEVDFLRYAYRHPEIYDNMLPCLPIAGVDGTLSKRMRKGAAHENVKAKTGTVTGVSSLAGYLTTANGHRICFSIINMGIRHSSSGRNFQDKVCQALCK